MAARELTALETAAPRNTEALEFFSGAYDVSLDFFYLGGGGNPGLFRLALLP
jgi:hypothetical protein